MSNWTYVPCDSKNQMIAYLVRKYRILEYHETTEQTFSVVWAVESRVIEGSSYRFVSMFQLDKIEGHWGYKRTTENQGLYFYSCPIALYGSAGAPGNDIAKDWRESVISLQSKPKIVLGNACLTNKTTDIMLAPFSTYRK